MTNTRRPASPLCFLFLALLTVGRATGAEPPVPAALAAPTGQILALTLTARGVQIYECRLLPGSEPARFEWVFKAPEADLFDAGDHQVGRHYAGPTWELTSGDGSKVVGRIKAKVDAPDGRGIPWLLLEALPTSSGGVGVGGGTLGQVQSIQRVNTVGGQAPNEGAEPAKAGQERRVAYSATYLFFVTRP